MTNKELFYFTGKCLMLDEDPGFRQVIIDRIGTGSIDWLKFVTICSNHLILPVIYLKFKSHDIIKHLPEDLSEFLKEIYDLNLSRNNQILEQLSEITKILNKGKIYPVFLKGAGNLLDDLYADKGERILGDIDLLVPEKDYLPAAKLLENDGYSIVNPFYDDIEIMTHYPKLKKIGVPAIIEIHRLPVKENHKSWFNTEIIDKEKKTVLSLNGCFVNSDKHKIIHNFIHSQLDNMGHQTGILSFRDIYDLYLLSKRIDFKQTIPDIKSKRKATAYYVFAGKTFGLNESFFKGNNFSAWIFAKKHDLNMRSETFYLVWQRIIDFYRIFIKYMGMFQKSFFSKKVRISLINRLSDPKWYSNILIGYFRLIFPKKED